MQLRYSRRAPAICVGLVCFLAMLLAGCGGGADGGSSSTVITYPTTGSYSWALPAKGSLSAPTMGLSLIHPSDKSIEYVIEPASSAISDVKVVNSGTVTVGNQTISNIKPDSLLYIVSGDVRRVPLQANGTAPAKQVKKTSDTSACKFIFAANDYATPDESRYIVSTTGTDGLCGTADDGQREIALGTSGGISSAAVLSTVLGVLHDDVTLAPKGWVRGNGILWWAPNSLLVMRMTSTPPITKVVAGNYRTVVAEDNNLLTVWQVTSARLVAETTLNATLTAGTGWESIGYDATNFYVYRNSSSLASCTTSSTWSVLKISVSSPAATQLANGTGCIGSASMGSGVLYATVLGATANTLLSLDKITGVSQTVRTVNTSSLVSVLTSAHGVHQMWLAVNLNTSSPAFTIDMIDEAGSILHSASYGFPMAIQDATTVNMNVSENRSRFLYASGYSNTKQFGDAYLEVYDSASQSLQTLGVIPGSTTFGTYPVFANVTTGYSTDVTAGFAIPTNGGTLNDASTKIFSVDVAKPDSLTFTTIKR